MAVLLHYVWFTLGSFLYDRGDLPKRPSPWASAPKDHVPEPQSFCPPCGRPSPLSFGSQDLIPDLESGRPSLPVFAPQDTPSTSAGARLLLRKREPPRTVLETSGPLQQLQPESQALGKGRTLELKPLGIFPQAPEQPLPSRRELPERFPRDHHRLSWGPQGFPRSFDRIDAGRKASGTIRAGGANPWSRGARTTKVNDYGAGTLVIVVATHRDPRPREVDVGGRAGDVARGGHARI